MKQKVAVIQEIRDSLKVGSLIATPGSYSGKGTWMVRVPMPGYGLTDVILRVTHGRVTVCLHDEYNFFDAFDFDEEFVRVVDWTVHNGECLISLVYDVPEIYTKVTKPEPLDAQEFLKAHMPKGHF